MDGLEKPTNYFCPEYDVDFVGNDIAYAAGTNSWQSCGEFSFFTYSNSTMVLKCPKILGDICKFTVENCKVWTWDREAAMCLLKSSDSGYQRRNGTVSGEVCCPRVQGSGACCPPGTPPS